MTTRIKFDWAEDISRPNKVMNFRGINFPRSYTLGAASWLIDAIPLSDSFLMILRSVYALILGRLPGYRIWLLMGTSAWQPDSRVVRHRKLWGGLKARGIEISHVAAQSEVTLEAEDKLKFFGSAQISELSLVSVAKAMFEERCTYLVALPEHASVSDLVAMGWTGKFHDDVRLLDYINRTDGVVVSKVGNFDDVERGLVAVAKPDVLKMLAN